MNLPELGVGIVYSSALEPLFDSSSELIDVLEIEPQTLWAETREKSEAPYLDRKEIVEHLAGLPASKLVHSVGTPVGGSKPPHKAHLPLLRRTVEQLGAPWASEHLGFNQTENFFTGFFLPPRQTEAGVKIYTDAIRNLRAGLGVPVAIETGVNYFRPRPDELPDGEFMAMVAREADCGILLDLHNIYCNQVNGRETVDQFLASLPLERVWEMHVAGGFEMDGFWLDAHSGPMPPPLIDIAREVIPQLPSLNAIIFEIFTSFLPYVGLDSVRMELVKMRELWSFRRPNLPARAPMTRTASLPPNSIGVDDWERALGNVVIGRQPLTTIEKDLATDPGVPLVTSLIKEFRASMVVQVYRLTTRLMMLALGPDIFRAILEDFWAGRPPEQFSSSEAEAFGDYIIAKDLRLPQLQNILALDRATVRTLIDGQTRLVKFDVDPLPMLRGLVEGRLLENPGQPGDYELEVTPDGQPI